MTSNTLILLSCLRLYVKRYLNFQNNINACQTDNNKLDQIFSVAFVETYLILNNIRAVYHI